ITPSAVMIPLVREDGEWKMLLTQRSGTISFGGQISFPGGKQEGTKGQPEMPEIAALREVLEEIHIDPRKISIVGELGVHIAHYNKDSRVRHSFHLVDNANSIQRVTRPDTSIKVYGI